MKQADLIDVYHYMDLDGEGHIEIEELEELAGEHLNKEEQEFLDTHGEYLFGLADYTNDGKIG